MPWIILDIVAAFVGLALLSLSEAPQLAALAGPSAGIVISADTSGSKLELLTERESRTYSVSPAASTVFKNLKPGDTVWFAIANESITLLALKRVEIGYVRAIGAALLSFAVIWGAVLFITESHPWGFALGLDWRLSNSQTQIYLWFLAFTIVYFAELGLRVCYTGYFGGIGAPAKLLALTGISALTFGAARANTTLKVLANPDAAAADKGVPELGRSRLEHFKDLFRNDKGRLDLGDFQMIVLTGGAITIYLVLSITFLKTLDFAGHVDLPPVDETLLGGTAATQGAYLLKKFGSRLGN
jgi:hypothetical protein